MHLGMRRPLIWTSRPHTATVPPTQVQLTVLHSGSHVAQAAPEVHRKASFSCQSLGKAHLLSAQYSTGKLSLDV